MPASKCRKYKKLFRVVFLSCINMCPQFCFWQDVIRWFLLQAWSLIVFYMRVVFFFLFSVDVEHFRWIHFSPRRAVCFTPDVFTLPSAVLIRRLHSHIISQLLSTFLGGTNNAQKEGQARWNTIIEYNLLSLTSVCSSSSSPPKMKNQFRIHAAVPGCWSVLCRLW